MSLMPVFTIYATLDQETKDHCRRKRFAAKCHSPWSIACRPCRTLLSRHPWNPRWCSGMISRSGCALWSDPTHGGAAVTFNEVLSQTIAMLHQHGRVPYRALKRQFAMQDDYLEDLKDAILFAHPEVIDEEGRGLVWTGASPTAAPATSPPPEAERPLHAVLLGVLALLQRQQRVTYRTLRDVFGV